jgi:hypothetical protein
MNLPADQIHFKMKTKSSIFIILNDGGGGIGTVGKGMRSLVISLIYEPSLILTTPSTDFYNPKF